MAIKDYKKLIEKLAGEFSLGRDLTPEKLNEIYDQQYLATFDQDFKKVVKAREVEIFAVE